jgi:transcriptional regulator with XRE-family HTH domain
LNISFKTPIKTSMNFTSHLTDEVLLKLIGERLARLRLGQNLTQEQVAEEAGLGLRTVQRLELGASATRLTSLLRVCRVLGLLEGFESLLPEEAVSPMELLKLKGRQRKRATGGRKLGSEGTASDRSGSRVKPWRWGDEEV